ncbi:lysozyme [Burkholderia cenocepacia]|uniref:lysozyme n=1 Tax=Burkholderia cenocepacia TaxID=95486 RepID=UPI00285CCA5F|nr:lysozyme [Burkholderia cenocepacia]MDR8054197.1 lysozyme [Burkholderia cenocepacia]MDR8064640.1 lysozyme [Burkholderia cenocepacia]
MIKISKKWLAGGVSAAVIAAAPFTAGWEGWRNNVYTDQVGVQTVCAGHTNRIGTETITKKYYSDEECARLLVKDLNKSNAQLHAALPGVTLTQGEEAIYTDFVFNLGITAFNAGSIRPMLLRGERTAACRKVLDYKYAGGNVSRGLQLRREAENRVCTGQSTVAEEAALRGVILVE